jgi:hypothetical protein
MIAGEPQSRIEGNEAAPMRYHVIEITRFRSYERRVETPIHPGRHGGCVGRRDRFRVGR